jgi:hypothetical protein
VQLAKGISLVALMLLCAGAASAAPLHRYIVEVGESLDVLAVKACFDGKTPGTLMTETSGAKTFLEDVRLLSAGPLPPQGDEVIALEGPRTMPASTTASNCVRATPADGGPRHAASAATADQWATVGARD